MANQGSILKQYIEDKRLNKTQLAKQLNMSKQNLYQLFESEEFQEPTIKKLEKQLKVKWKDIADNTVVNIDVKVPRDTFTPENKSDDPLEKAILNLSETDKINARNIERLINILEAKLLGKQELSVRGTPTTENLEDERSKKASQ